MTQKHTIKWIIFHQPVDIFLRTANAFSEEISQLTNNRINVEVYTLDDYCKKFKDQLSIHPMALIESGETQMSQMYTNDLAEARATDFYALELPFLFRSHDHATKVMEGSIGENLLNNTLPSTTKVRGLAFTYSGGYRVMASSKKIRSADDLKGLNIGVRTNPIYADMAKAFGCESTSIVESDVEDTKKLRTKINTIETTLPRYVVEADRKVHKHIVNTAHSLFLTTLIINENFWNSLSIDDQISMRKAALNSARKERNWSIEDAKKIAEDKQEQEKLGIQTFYNLPKEEVQKLKDSVGDVYKKYTKFFTPGLVDSILKS